MSLTIKRIIEIFLSVIIILGIYLGYPNYDPLPNLTAYFVSVVLGVFIGTAPVVIGNDVLLHVDGQFMTLSVSPECTGLISMLLFIVVIFITPGINFRHKFYSIAFVPILFAVNLLRIVFEVYIGEIFSISSMVIFHSTVGQIMFFGALILCYIIFLHAFRYNVKVKYQT